MSNNQSRGERTEFAQYRKTARSGNSNQQSHYPGGVASKGGGGASSAPLNPGSRSFKKHNNNAQAVQPKARSANVDGSYDGQNGPRQQQQPTGRVSDAPVANPNPKTTDASTLDNSRVVPQPYSNASNAAPTPNVSAPSLEPEAPRTPAKDASKSFPLQFGSISPGFMNGVQIPARTSSAPPNLDEQKKAQARQDSLKAAATGAAIPIPSIPKQHLPKKDAGHVDQHNIGQVQPLSKSKRDTQVSAAQSVLQAQKPAVHAIPGMPMQIPFHQPQVPIQFGGPNPQMQSQAIPGASLPLPMQMPIPMGSPPMQQTMFIPGLQPHPVQSQTMMHQSQNFHFPAQMGHQLQPQLGGMGINMTPPFAQQQTGKYGASRKSVKITHPETHEELKLDNSPGPRPHPNVPPQSQPMSSYPPNHPMNFYANSYSATPPYFPVGTSVSKNSTQISSVPTSLPLRSYNQVTVKPPVSSHGEKKQLPSSVSVGEVECAEPTKLHGDISVHQKDGKQSSLGLVQQSKPGLQPTSTPVASVTSASIESTVTNNSTSLSSRMGCSDAVSTNSTVEEKKGVVIPGSIEEQLNQQDRRGQQDQVVGHSTLHSNLGSQLPDAASNTILSKESPTTIHTSKSSHLTNDGAEAGRIGDASRNIDRKDVNNGESEPVIIGRKKQGEDVLSENPNVDDHNKELSLESLSPEASGIYGKIESSNQVKCGNGGSLEQEENLKKYPGSYSDDVKMADSLVVAAHTEVGGNAEGSVSMGRSSIQDSESFSSGTSPCVADSIVTIGIPFTMPASVDQMAALVIPSPDTAPKIEDENIENNDSGLPSPSLNVNDKGISDANVAKTAVPRGKKKKKELYRKAEAAGTSSDLYMAYKGPEEKKGTAAPAESMEKASKIGTKQTSAEVPQENNVPGETATLSKIEPDDWEDAAEISPQLGSAKKENHGSERDGAGLMTKKYSRDFLLKFKEQCCDLPEGFEITSDIADTLCGSRESYPTPGRNIDRSSGGSRPDRRLGGDDDRWNKFPGPLVPGRGDIRADVGYAGNIIALRPGQGSNYGVLRNPRAQPPPHYAGGILPMQPLGQSGLQRNNFELDRWQRGSNFQKVMSPQTPPPVMHKAERKYEIGKVTDEEQAKQRQLKSILNKLTPQNFEKLFQQVKEVNIDNVVTLTGVISQIFDKALMEPTFCEMYADFCFHLAADLPELSVENERITFKRLLLNKCQEEFERGEREEEEANKANEEGEVEQTAEEREEKRLRVRRRMLGNIRLIGELYKKRMLTERIMHECINKLLGHYQNPDEENIEALCKLMSTIGEMIDHPKAKDHIDAYFDMMAQMSCNMKLSSRVRFMLKDSIDLRKNKWQQRRKVEGPKKIEEVHRDAAQERHAQAGRMSRAPSMGSSTRRGPAMDFAPRAPSVLSPGSQMGGFRAAPPQLRGYGSQDVRVDERHSYDRTMSVPLPQRPIGDDSITLGPQGGLMSSRGRPSTPNNHLAEITSPADARRIGAGLNGFSSVPEQTAYGRREDLMPRIMPELHLQERSNTYGNRPTLGGPPNSMPIVSAETIWTEEQLRDKSMATIREFYSARDEKEVALCIKDLNAPSFYPSMISIWVADSFERKDMERDLLTKLLISLSKPQDAMISKDQLIQGFESVLAILEDAVNDAPKAAEFLGRIFAHVILENLVSLSKIGHLIHKGGEEPGNLVEIGLAAEVLGTILDIIKSEKGDLVLSEIRAASNLKLENFRPLGSQKPLRIDKFM